MTASQFDADARLDLDVVGQLVVQLGHDEYIPLTVQVDAVVDLEAGAGVDTQVSPTGYIQTSGPNAAVLLSAQPLPFHSYRAVEVLALISPR